MNNDGQSAAPKAGLAIRWEYVVGVVILMLLCSLAVGNAPGGFWRAFGLYGAIRLATRWNFDGASPND